MVDRYNINRGTLMFDFQLNKIIEYISFTVLDAILIYKSQILYDIKYHYIVRLNFFTGSVPLQPYTLLFTNYVAI